ncbi:MAG: fatty acid desaturase CarF family protein [Pseudomonadota bacterium]|jgi:ubiquitin-conjugating enzyme E2 variant|nr:fatty acid desaturase CarF family protein [Pseudomonadota bacterium]
MPVTIVVTALKSAASILGGLFLADFISGLIHWFEDRYGNPKWPVLGHTIRANQEHHFRPRAFLEGSFLSRNREVFVLGALFLAGFWVTGTLNLFTGSAVLFGMFANEFHRAAHRSPKENGRLITALQKTGLAQSFQHHAAHHRQGKDTHYCVVTNYTNPILERVGFFPALERIVKATTGRVPRLDESVNARFRKVA